MRPSLLLLASVMTRLRCSTSMAHGVQLWGSLAMRGLTDSAQYMEKVQKDGSGPGSASYLRVGPALFFMSSYFTICQRQTAVSSGPWVDAKFFTAPSSCTEEPVFVTFLHTLLQLPFLELCPLCASLKIAGSAIWRQICTIPTSGAAYGGNPRSERVKQLECDQILCMIATHVARNPALSALRLPSVQISPCHIIFDCHCDSPAQVDRAGHGSSMIGFRAFQLITSWTPCPPRWMWTTLHQPH